MHNTVKVPNPGPDESKEDFIKRCMSNDEMVSSFPDQDQRLAVCHTALEKEVEPEKSIEPQIEFAAFSAELKAIKAAGDYDFEANITTNSIDRDGDVVLPLGVSAKQFAKNPVVLWSHDHKSPPIAKGVKLERHDNKLVARAKFAPRPENHEGPWQPDVIKHLVKEGFLNAISIGFRTKESRYPSKKDLEVYGKDVQNVISKSELIEFSIVSVPANQNALITGVTKAVSSGVIDSEFAQKAFGIEIKETEPEIKSIPVEDHTTEVKEISEVVTPEPQPVIEPILDPITVKAVVRRHLTAKQIAKQVDNAIKRKLGKLY